MLSEKNLREIVRQALAETLGANANPSSRDAGNPPEVITVAVENGDDLRAFALRLLSLGEADKSVERIREGRLILQLAEPSHCEAAKSARPQTREWPAGVLSETKLLKLVKRGDRLLLGAGTVITPLAREKAAELGVKTERK